MLEDMNLSINGQSKVPPGFRFHPTEEELLHYYLRKKVAYEKIDLDVIREVDLNKLEPWDIQEKCKLGSTPQNDWYFFSHKDKKYPTGTRTNRATAAGFWKATGRDKIIYSGFRRIGLRKTLVFYKGRAPHGQKSDWIMHEYRLDESNNQQQDIIINIQPSNSSIMGESSESIPEDGWVVCRVFRKKNYQKTIETPKTITSTSLMDSNNKSQMLIGSSNDAVLNQLLLYMGSGSCKLEKVNGGSSSNTMIMNNDDEDDDDDMRITLTANINNNNTSITELLQERFMHLPRLELDSPSIPINSTSPFDQDRMFKSCYQTVDDLPLTETAEPAGVGCGTCDTTKSTGINDWVALDRLVASQLNGQVIDSSKQQLSCFSDSNAVFNLCPGDHDHLHNSQRLNQVYSNDNDLWSSFTKSSSSPSSSDPLCHLSV